MSVMGNKESSTLYSDKFIYESGMLVNAYSKYIVNTLKGRTKAPP
jgi:hypothetical protein